MLLRWLKAIVILPGTVLVAIPSAIICFESFAGKNIGIASAEGYKFWLAFLCAALGVMLSGSSMRQFLLYGDGTAAPWDPPRNFVVRGPYRFVRNPMITGVVLLLFAESLSLSSLGLAIWGILFFLCNAVYFPLYEEPSLKARFGDAYDLYCAHVPRWLPRLTPWIDPFDVDDD